MNGDISTLADSVLVAVRGYLAKSLEPFAARFKSIDERIAAIPAGPKGERGEPGKDGADGKSVQVSEIVAVLAPEVERSIVEAVAALPKPVDGKDGAAGADGKDGAPGEKGEKGDAGAAGPMVPHETVAGLVAAEVAKAVAEIPKPRDGADGKPGEKGFDGLPGADGADGSDGRDGKEGPPGRDALQIDILDAIESGRSYSRSTYARQFGGTWRALRPTDAIDVTSPEVLAKAGWVVVADGVADIGLEMSEDGRMIKFAVMLTSGRCDVRKFAVPTMIYRGLWSADAPFVRGDAVTWDGNLWHCERETQTEPGVDRNGDWRLAAKKGRDGRDGRRIDPAPANSAPVRLA